VGEVLGEEKEKGLLEGQLLVREEVRKVKI
jgi:hypothetical protein